MQLIDKYGSFWPIFAATLLFLILGLWWRLSSSKAMERAPKSPDWVRRYRTGGFPFRRELLGSPKLCWWALLLALVIGAGFAVLHLICTGMVYLKQPELFFHSRYGLLLTLLCAVGSGAVYCVLKLLFSGEWVALPGTLLFAVSSASGHVESCLLAVSLLFLVLYLRAEKPGFPAELLYLVSVLTLSSIVALRPGLIWLFPLFPLVHWYKLLSQRRSRQLSGGRLFLSLLAALAAWLLVFILATVLRRFLMLGFRLSVLTSLFSGERFRLSLLALMKSLPRRLLATPTRGMFIDPMLDAPLLGLGFWGCCSAWTLARQRRDVRGVFALVALAALTVVWLLSGIYTVSLGLVLTAACVLRDADAAGKRSGAVLLTLAAICWTVFLQIGAWYLPLTPGLVEHLF